MNDQERKGPSLASWLLWTLVWEAVVSVGAAAVFIIYALVLDRQYAADGIYSADSAYAAQDVVFPLWVLAALLTPFVVYVKLERSTPRDES